MKQTSWIAIGVGAMAIASTLGVLGPRPTLGQAAPVQLSLRQSLIDFFGRDTEDRNRGSNGGSRGDGQVAIATSGDAEFCILTPGRNETVWHQQPLFVMQGAMARLEVRSATSGSTTTLWRAPATPNGDNLVLAQFDAAPLEPGSRYALVFLQNQPNYSEPVAIYRQNFTVMPAGAARDQIAADLQHIETELAPQGVEAIAQAKASYLIEKDLPADALHVLFAVQAPSTSLASLRAETTETICRFEIGL
ncbi:MAG: hypothetical protein WA939_19285 [Nodosilinea sp.]